MSYDKYEKKPLKCFNFSLFLDPLASNALQLWILRSASIEEETKDTKSPVDTKTVVRTPEISQSV